MRNSLHFLAVLLFATTAAHAQHWSLGVGTGPFVFGTFVEKTSVVGTELGTTTITSRLSAAARPGLDADLERDFGRWLGVRVGAAWTYAPPRVKGSGGSGVTIDAGHVGVTTIWRSNRFGIEGEVSDTVTASPFRLQDITPSAKGVSLERPQNVHTTVGIRYRF